MPPFTRHTLPALPGVGDACVTAESPPSISGAIESVEINQTKTIRAQTLSNARYLALLISVPAPTLPRGVCAWSCGLSRHWGLSAHYEQPLQHGSHCPQSTPVFMDLFPSCSQFPGPKLIPKTVTSLTREVRKTFRTWGLQQGFSPDNFKEPTPPSLRCLSSTWMVGRSVFSFSFFGE